MVCPKIANFAFYVVYSKKWVHDPVGLVYKISYEDQQMYVSIPDSDSGRVLV